MAWLAVAGLLATAVLAQKQTRKAPPPVKAKPVAAAPAAPSKWPVREIVIEGNRQFRSGQVVAATGLKIGQLAGQEEFEAARDRLLNTGAFEIVGYRFEPAPDGQGFRASFQVTEVEQQYPIRFEDIAVPPEQILDYLQRQDPLFGPRVPGTEPVLKRYTAWVEEFLGSLGKKEKLRASLMTSEQGELEIVFRPATLSPSIAEVRFSGNQVVQQTLLQNAIAGVAIGLPYSERRFRQLLDASIRPVYEQRGRIRVSFPKISVERARDVNGLAVLVDVQEGESYTLGDVTLEGVGDPKDLLALARFPTENVANFVEIEAATERIRQALRRSGYLKVSSTTERRIDDGKRTVSLVIRMDPGPRYRFGKLVIEGLDIQTEPVIRKTWGMKEGAPFNVEYPDLFLKRVREEGIFDNLGETKALVSANDQSQVADVTLVFKGAPPPKPGNRFP